MTQVVAIGDVHGCYDLLVEAVKPHLNTNVELIFTGDLFDRSPQPDGDAKVLTKVRAMQNTPLLYGLYGVTVLRGNHEQLLIDAINDPEKRDIWEYNGGNPDFLGFAKANLDWLESLPYYAVRGKYLFVHAGVRPQIPLYAQDSQDLLWIRAPFISDTDHELPYTIVHGHTPVHGGEPEVHPHRINIDTGAFFSGVLTAYPITV